MNKVVTALLACLLLAPWIPTVGAQPGGDDTALPNLEVDDLEAAPDDPSPGENVTFVAEIENSGEADAGAFDVVFEIDGEEHDTVRVDVLRADDTIRIASAAWNATPGEHTLRILLDSANEVEEADEDDNTEELELDIEPATQAEADDQGRDGSDERDADQDPGAGGNGSRENRSTPERRDGDASDRSGEDAGGQANDRAASRTDGVMRVGQVSFQLDGDRLTELTYRGVPILSSLTIPGLAMAQEIERKGNELQIEGEDAELEVRADPGLRFTAESESTLEATLAPGVRAERIDDRLELRADGLLVTVDGDELSLDGRTLTLSGELELSASAHPRAEQATWEPPTQAGEDAEADDQAPRFPLSFEGRYVSFLLNHTGLENLTIHGVPVGSITFNASSLSETRRAGAMFQAEGDGFEVRAIDAPTVQLRIEGERVTTEIPPTQSLPSGAKVLLTIQEDQLDLRVQRPSQGLSDQTPVDHVPSQERPARTPGPTPGLETTENGSSFQVRSDQPGELLTQFQGELNGSTGAVGLSLTLTRAMLIQDTDGDGHVGIGEPALITAPLGEGNITVQGDALVTTFPLWSGNLTLTVEPGQGTAKVTYAVEDLNAPPGTLFVLETVARAPDNATLTPTADGVIVENGTMRAVYSAAGPVSVDGAPAWANHAILAQSDGTVSVLVAYPAGDTMEHDPTVAIQSAGTVLARALTASPWSILVGAIAAMGIVAITVATRRRGPS